MTVVSDQELVTRTVRHALFAYRDPLTGAENQTAFTGETVRLLPEDADRGDRQGAFVETTASSGPISPKIVESRFARALADDVDELDRSVLTYEEALAAEIRKLNEQNQAQATAAFLESFSSCTPSEAVAWMISASPAEVRQVAGKEPGLAAEMFRAERKGRQRGEVMRYLQGLVFADDQG